MLMLIGNPVQIRSIRVGSDVLEWPWKADARHQIFQADVIRSLLMYSQNMMSDQIRRGNTSGEGAYFWSQVPHPYPKGPRPNAPSFGVSSNYAYTFWRRTTMQYAFGDNTYGKWRYRGQHARLCMCTNNASCGLSAIAEFLVHASDRSICHAIAIIQLLAHLNRPFHVRNCLYQLSDPTRYRHRHRLSNEQTLNIVQSRINYCTILSYITIPARRRSRTCGIGMHLWDLLSELQSMN